MLRKTKQLKGFAIRASDGERTHLEEAVVSR